MYSEMDHVGRYAMDAVCQPRLAASVSRGRPEKLCTLLLLAGISAGGLGCGIGRHPPDLGIQRGETSVGHEVVIELDATLSDRILDVRAGDRGELLLLTSERAIQHLVGADIADQTPFPEANSLFPARIVDGSSGLPAGYVGLATSEPCLLLLDTSGRRVGCYPSNSSGEFVVADLTGDGRDEIVVETADGKGIAAYERSGRRLWAVDASGYVTALEALGVSEGDNVELVLHIYPGRQGRESGTYLVVTRDGRVKHEWSGSPIGDLEATPWRSEASSFLTLDDDAIAISSSSGERIQAVPVPDAGRFRELRAVELLSGDRVVLATGGGYWPYHLVAVFTADGDLIYHEVGEERAYGLAAPRWAEGRFFVAVGHRVLQYELQSGRTDGDL